MLSESMHMKNARACIEHNILPIGFESIDVVIAAGRVSGSVIKAPCDNPEHNEAIRDGFVFAAEDGGGSDGKSYRICGEIAAGSSDSPQIANGCAYRIYTGAVIPEGVTRVIPIEVCSEKGDRLIVAQPPQPGTPRFIANQGCRVRRNQKIVDQGVVLEGQHIATLASLPLEKVLVSRLPIVACYCTGSELVEPGEKVDRGRKSSINGWTLAELLPRYGGIIKRSGLLLDDPDSLESMFVEATDGSMDIVITTGGMGPGKYDLVKSVFIATGGQVILESLPMRPGKSILFGLLNGVVVISLPGPPPAVRTLINELVGPVLRLMQGARLPWPVEVEAEALHDIAGGRNGVVRCKDGVLSFDRGRCFVRLTEPLEPASCIILIGADRKDISKGELVTVHLLN